MDKGFENMAMGLIGGKGGCSMAKEALLTPEEMGKVKHGICGLNDDHGCNQLCQAQLDKATPIIQKDAVGAERERMTIEFMRLRDRTFKELHSTIDNFKKSLMDIV